MDFLALKDISERYLDLVSPSSPEKVLLLGQALGLQPGQRVLDMGCGFGAVLALWAEHYGVVGAGVEVRPYACERARNKLRARGLADRVEIVCGNAAQYDFAPGAYDVAACIGASFIYGGFAPTIRRLRGALRPGGQLVIGEPYWRTRRVPADYARRERGVHTELELLQQARAEGCELAYVVRASEDDWDRYEAGNWLGLLRWLDDNPGHPDRQAVLDHLHESQAEYLGPGREYFGWAMYVLKPAAE